MDKAGECVETIEEQIQALGRTWALTIEVYHSKYSSDYNLYGTLKDADAGLLEKTDAWETTNHNVRKSELNEEINELTKTLLNYAEDKIEARNIEIDVDINI